MSSLPFISEIKNIPNVISSQDGEGELQQLIQLQRNVVFAFQLWKKIFLMASPARTGEGELQQLIQLQRSRLRPTELLNVDTVLEEVIQALVTKPLRWAPSFFNRNNCLLRLQLCHVKFKLTNASETAPLFFTYSRTAILNKTWKPYWTTERKSLEFTQKCSCYLSYLGIAELSFTFDPRKTKPRLSHAKRHLDLLLLFTFPFL